MSSWIKVTQNRKSHTPTHAHPPPTSQISDFRERGFAWNKRWGREWSPVLFYMWRDHPFTSLWHGVTVQENRILPQCRRHTCLGISLGISVTQSPTCSMDVPALCPLNSYFMILADTNATELYPKTHLENILDYYQDILNIMVENHSHEWNGCLWLQKLTQFKKGYSEKY